ncbi:MAG: hypothetical protein AAGH90_12740 [Pseudomonadota bacterium]
MFTALYVLGWVLLFVMSALSNPLIYSMVFRKPKESDDFNR